MNGSAPPDIVHIDLADPRWDAFGDVLDAAERERAARYRGELLQRRFRRGRIALRLTLAQRLRRDPAALRLRPGRYGKPELDPAGPFPASLFFNLSHSADAALLALASRPLGIDLERLGQSRLDPDALLPAVAHPLERAALPAGPCPEPVFYALWTRKEAYCKALGLGLNLDPRGVRFEPDGGLWRAVGADGPQDWFAAPVGLPGFAAHVCLPYRCAPPPPRSGESVLDAYPAA